MDEFLLLFCLVLIIQPQQSIRNEVWFVSDCQCLEVQGAKISQIGMEVYQ